jgi:hypothetical protein
MHRIAPHTIFVARENVMFLGEWLAYHAGMGVSQFFLYDNSGSIGRRGSTPTTNKYGVDFAAMAAHLSDEEIGERIRSAIDGCDANCELIPWEPRDREGRIVYGQSESIVD